MDHWFLALIAVLLLVIFPFVPQLLKLRLRVLQKLGWDWAVRLLENHFDGWVIAGRVGIVMALLVVAAIALNDG